MSDETTKQAQTLSLLHPLNIYPSVVGTVVLLFNSVEYSILTTAVGGAALVVGVGSTIFNRYVNINKFYEIAGKREHEKRLQELQDRIEYLKENLSSNDRQDIVEQLNSVEKKVHTFNEIINERFKGGGLAYSRFSGVADSIFSNALKSYEEILLLLRQANSIDYTSCARQIRELQKSGGSEDKIRELNTRIEVRTDLLKRIDKLVLSNEKAITKLDLTMSSLGDISTENEINWAMKELQSLSDVLTNDKNGDFL